MQGDLQKDRTPNKRSNLPDPFMHPYPGVDVQARPTPGYRARPAGADREATHGEQ